MALKSRQVMEMTPSRSLLNKKELPPQSIALKSTQVMEMTPSRSLLNQTQMPPQSIALKSTQVMEMTCSKLSVPLKAAKTQQTKSLPRDLSTQLSMLAPMMMHS